MTNARLEPWGYFGRGWTNERVALHAVTPTPWPVLAYPSAWTPRTNGPVTADAVPVQIDSAPDVARYRGTLRGKLALVGRPLDLPAHFTAQGERYTEAELDAMGQAAILGELPGSDRRLRDEVVMLGAHFDSWQAGTGATDNAAGVAVTMEAMRLIKASGVPLRRTVRIALWTGEQQALLGSRAYGARHLGDRAAMALEPEHAKVSACFNPDNGTGQIRGIYAQGNAAAAPLFGEWMAPFASRGTHTVTLRNTTGTGHLAFDAIGVPGFQFIQDAIEYGSHTPHSNMDLFERVQPDDMKWNAVVVAAFVLQTANRDERLPRKPLPTVTPRPTAPVAPTGR